MAFIAKIIFIKQICLFFRLFEMATNQIQQSRLELRPIIKFLMAENKPCEIYRMCDLYREESFNQKMFRNGLNIGLPL